MLLGHRQDLFGQSDDRDGLKMDLSQYVHSQLGGFSRIPCLSSLVLQLHKGLNEHTIRVEHLCANVSMLLYFFVIIKFFSNALIHCFHFAKLALQHRDSFLTRLFIFIIFFFF